MDQWWMMVVGMVALAAVAQASERNTPVRLEPDSPPARDDGGGPSLKLTLYEVSVDQAKGKKMRSAVRQRQSGAPALPLDGYAAVCFEADSDGYVTLWESSMTDGSATLLLPNDHSVRDNPNNEHAYPVKAGQQTCVGDGEWAFRVDGPIGSRQIYAHWTATLDDAVPADAYATLGRSAESQRSLVVVRTGSKAELRYEVIASGGKP